VKNKGLNTVISTEISEGIYLQVKESTDACDRVVHFKSMKPISDELFLGCLLIFLESQAPDLTQVPTDEFNCH